MKPSNICPTRLTHSTPRSQAGTEIGKLFFRPNTFGWLVGRSLCVCVCVLLSLCHLDYHFMFMNSLALFYALHCTALSVVVHPDEKKVLYCLNDVRIYCANHVLHSIDEQQSQTRLLLSHTKIAITSRLVLTGLVHYSQGLSKILSTLGIFSSSGNLQQAVTFQDAYQTLTIIPNLSV